MKTNNKRFYFISFEWALKVQSGSVSWEIEQFRRKYFRLKNVYV